jgi:hypothetical protein
MTREKKAIEGGTEFVEKIETDGDQEDDENDE